MEPNKELFDFLFLEKVKAAQATPPGEKLFAGLRLFDEVVRRMHDGIRHQYPDATADEWDRELDRRLLINRVLGNRR